MEIQRSLQKHNEANPEGTISTGIGLNWGEIIRDNDDIFGHSVNMAARPANSAKGGQILVSSSVREKSKSQDNFEFVDTDYRKLKGIGNEEVSELLLKVTLISTCQWSWIGGWQKKLGWSTRSRKLSST
ncbi:adenylate/guanylate cyclase domain-containing protein [Candidatus Bipolaricaulota bacterium]|nr:adenylate/guanylate cyclase domain-containing protein [Candidatus Bipolaricaulota bacterium]